MIAFKYTKTDGAEYLSHLDLLRHVYRTLRRAEIGVKYSEGFHKHPRIFLNNPLPTGVKSVAEYCAVDSDFTGDFTGAFNAFSPVGVKCVAHIFVDENPNYAYSIERCRYFAHGAVCSDDLLLRKSIIITDLKGREIDIRPRICAVERADGGVFFTVKSGQENLRADLFASFLDGEFGGKCDEIIKVAAFGNLTF